VSGIQFQCRLAQFVISNKGVMRCYLAANLNWGLNGNMKYSNGTGDQLPRKRGAPDGKCCVAGARNEKEECQIYALKRRWGLWSVQTSGGAPKQRGVRSAECNKEAPIQVEEHRCELRSALPAEEG